MAKYTRDPLDLDALDDDEDLTDDEVFTRCGKMGPFEENGVSKPLMAPRHRTSKGTSELLHTRVRKVPPFRVIWGPLMYGVVALIAILGIIALVVFVINTFMDRYHGVSSPLLQHPSPSRKILPIRACSNLSVDEVWAKTFPMLTTESALRLVDVNKDGTLDIVMGFGTGADAFYYPPIVCKIYFSGVQHCGGGMMALDGLTGRELWRYYTAHEIFAVNCNVDLNGDKVPDCLGAGRMAGLVAISGHDGHPLWIFDDVKVLIRTSNVYTPLYIRDLNNDTIPDLVVVHGGDPLKEPGSLKRLIGRLLVMSGKTGEVLQYVEVPDKRESYYSPQLLVHPDGSEYILFGTGGETHGGSLWCILLSDLILGKIHNAKAIYTDPQKGVMTPPVLVDLTGDGVSDIVMAMFNSTVFAFNGLTFEQLWYISFPSSETYSTPGIGFFNNDTIPDFIVNYQTGPGFPIYYFTQTTVLDGRNGVLLMKDPVKMMVGTQSSPLVISSQGYGNDVFLYWVADCHGEYAGKALEFDFLEGTTVHEQSRSDFCKQRFKEKLFTRMYAMSQTSGVPGTIVYDSDAKKSQEFGSQLNYTEIGREFLRTHPEYIPHHQRYKNPPSEDLSPEYSKPDMDNQRSYGHYIRGGTRRYPEEIRSDSRYEDDRGESYHDTPRRPILPQNPDYEGASRYEGDTSQDSIDSPSDLDPENYLRRINPWSNLPARRGSYSGANRPHRPHRWRVRRKRSEDNKKPKRKRHVGPHDGGGIQRTISTGTLAPAFGENARTSMDIVYATFWFYPAKTQALFPEDRRCVERMISQESQRFQVANEYHGLDHDAYEKAVLEQCLRKSGHLTEESRSSEEYNPFDRQMGQMTVYRSRITCSCPNEDAESTCARFLPFDQQGWPSYMGREANCLFKQRSVP